MRQVGQNADDSFASVGGFQEMHFNASEAKLLALGCFDRHRFLIDLTPQETSVINRETTDHPSPEPILIKSAP